MKGATASEIRLARRLPGRTWLLRAGAVLLLAGVVQMGAAGPASAHSVGGGPAASNYRTNVRGIAPAIPGVSVRVVDGGNQLELINRGPREVTILGYENEPYLRVGPSGVFENESSPSTFSNRSITAPTRIPAEFSADARPDWRRISSQPVAIFHDHRAHWSGGADPTAVQRARSRRQVVTPNWQLPLEVGDKTSILSGSIEWVPGPSPWPWAAVAVALAALVLLISRSGWQAKALAGATALAVVTDAVHTVGVWTGSTAPILTQLYGSATSFAGWVIAAIAIQRLLTGKLEAGRTFMLLAAIFLALAGAAPDVSALARSQLPSGLDPVLTRAAISATLGLGAGMLLAALLGRQLSAPRPAPASGAATGKRPRPPGAKPPRGGTGAGATIGGGMAQAGARKRGGQQGGAGSPNRQRGSSGGGSKKRSRESGERYITDRSIRDERSTQREELVHTDRMDRPTAPAGSSARRPAAPVTSPSTQRLAIRLRPWMPWISTVARLGLAVVWAWAARAKILDPDGAVLSVRAYRLLPEALVHPVAWGLPFLELAVAVLLAAGVAIRLAAATSTGLLLVFIAGIASAWARGLQIDCGCFSTGGAATHVGASQYLGEVLRDAGLAVVSIALVWRPWSRLALGGEADRRIEPPPQPDPKDRLEDG